MFVLIIIIRIKRLMQTKIKAHKTCEGKMLSGWVNKYMNERGTFDTEVCQYKFGMEDEDEQ